MDDSKPLLAPQARPPVGFDCPPVLELDCVTLRGDGVPILKTIMEEALRLSAGQILAIQIDFMPILLCRIMANRGFDHWSEPTKNGKFRIHFLKEMSSRSVNDGMRGFSPPLSRRRAMRSGLGPIRPT